tara:strand:+ start:369 stop:743 length:375 start_codon:yes stop_codon:yes gene_type:complete
MNNYQLFKQIPPKEFVEDIIRLYGPGGFDVNYYFTIDDIIKNNVVDQLNNKQDDLKKYYLPCKCKFINMLNPPKSITLLRQLLRPYNYKLSSLEKYNKGKKYLLYNLSIKDDTIKQPDLIIKFD